MNGQTKIIAIIKMTIMKKNIILILFMLLSIIPSFGQVKIGGTHHLAEEVYKPYGYYNQPIKKQRMESTL